MTPLTGKVDTCREHAVFLLLFYTAVSQQVAVVADVHLPLQRHSNPVIAYRSSEGAYDKHNKHLTT